MKGTRFLICVQPGAAKTIRKKRLKHYSAAFRSSVFHFIMIVLSGTVVVKTPKKTRRPECDLRVFSVG